MTRPTILASLVGLALLLAGCDGSDGAAEKLPGNTSAGKDGFIAAGCGACHTFTPAGTSGQVGPNLDRSLEGKDAAFLRESIVAPNLKVAEGFRRNVMPSNFARRLSDRQITDIVKFLAPATE
jgi:mono/diheme cytochrome c family protein